MPKIGEQLLKPEDGWKRIDDTNPNIHYLPDSGYWNSNNIEEHYNSTCRYSSNNGVSYAFILRGDRFRIISGIGNDYSEECLVKINGKFIDSFSMYSSVTQFQTLVYEKNNLRSGVYVVEIFNNTSSKIGLDAIDVGFDGDIILPNSTVKASANFKEKDLLMPRNTKYDYEFKILPSQSIQISHKRKLVPSDKSQVKTGIVYKSTIDLENWENINAINFSY
ncbi:hypothetical protein EEL30_22260 [Brevibacillus laterosporus]|uniref:Uncharacterized protein n=1 Tax=Brevibacillus laterosporus TaxID=1465 RepID=A0A518VCU2_BRELA|nr:hypothetical protein EEL30_22260 [Brevibacillus laterosporus]